MTRHYCRFCDLELTQSFVDLGKMPLSNSFLRAEDLDLPESYYPLHARVCGNCFLVQVAQAREPEAIFINYPYFSSFSSSWLRHAGEFACQMRGEIRLDSHSRIIEIGCNDGYFLKNFLGTGIEVLGIEPALNVAEVAVAAGIPVVKEFFREDLGISLARKGKLADLLVANNVLAHVPDINGFVAGLVKILKPSGLLSIEVPHLLRMIERRQFDTVYHEHFSYFSLLTAERVFLRQGLKIVDAEPLETHGGSLRLYIRHEKFPGVASARLEKLRETEVLAGLDKIETYRGFAGLVTEAKRNILDLLIRLKNQGKRLAAYGAPAKGTVLLNYCGIREDFFDYAVDRNPRKQGCWIPGTRIPIVDPKRVFETRPNFLFLLAWNLEQEILEQMAAIRKWGGRFIVPFPDLKILG